MDKLARFTISHARFTGLLIAAVLIGGLAVYATQPRQEDPEITLRSAQVVTLFPGMSPERIEQLITRPVEDRIKELSEIDDIKSISMTGVSIVSPEVDARFSDMDLSQSQFDAIMAEYVTVVHHLFSPKNYSYWQRIKLAAYWLFRKAP